MMTLRLVLSSSAAATHDVPLTSASPFDQIRIMMLTQFRVSTHSDSFVTGEQLPDTDDHRSTAPGDANLYSLPLPHGSHANARERVSCPIDLTTKLDQACTFHITRPTSASLYHRHAEQHGFQIRLSQHIR